MSIFAKIYVCFCPGTVVIAAVVVVVAAVVAAAVAAAVVAAVVVALVNFFEVWTFRTFDKIYVCFFAQIYVSFCPGSCKYFQFLLKFMFVFAQGVVNIF